MNPLVFDRTNKPLPVRKQEQGMLKLSARMQEGKD
jgi:hypothetical protein